MNIFLYKLIGFNIFDLNRDEQKSIIFHFNNQQFEIKIRIF